MNFLLENKLFMVSAILLTGLIAGAAGLQEIRDRQNIPGTVNAPHAPVSTVSAPQAPSKSTGAAQWDAPAAVQPPPPAAVKPSVQGVYNGERGDD